MVFKISYAFYNETSSILNIAVITTWYFDETASHHDICISV